jgi:hypothetical protein
MEIDNDLSETTKPRSGIGCLKVIGCGLLILALLAVIGMFWHQNQMASQLQRTLAELDRTDPGWRLEDIEAARDDVPEAENSARVIIDAAGQLPQRWPSAEFSDEHIHSLAANEMLSGEDFVRLSKELASARAALEIVSKVADMPRGRHSIHYDRNPIATLLPHLQECRRLVSVLSYESMRRNQKGDSKNALTACRAALNVARSISDEPIFISQLVRIACVNSVCNAIERTLGQGEPPPEDMSVLQKMLEEEDVFPSLLLATRGERALMHQVFDLVDRGEMDMKHLEGFAGSKTTTDWLQNFATSFWRMDTREDNALFLSLMTRRINEIQRPIHEQTALEKAFDQEFQTVPKNAMITRMLMPAISKVSEGFRRTHASVRCTIVALAAERYRRDKKTWPDSIDQLCPNYLATVPLDPYDGKRLRYKRVIDGVIIYSVGQDMADNGGNLDREHLTSPGVDLGFRLWDAAKRRQPPRPKPPSEMMGGPGVVIPPHPE